LVSLGRQVDWPSSLGRVDNGVIFGEYAGLSDTLIAIGIDGPAKKSTTVITHQNVMTYKQIEWPLSFPESTIMNFFTFAGTESPFLVRIISESVISP
jgi:hypothetical protein